jgi:uncharacterized SAM-binding protein YcdF (DUF218 family)
VGLLLMAAILRRRWPCILGLAVILVCALPVTSTLIWRGLEADYPYHSFELVAEADAILVLSGILGGVETPDGIIPQWGDSVDRFFVGIDLFKANKAPMLIFTRGKHPQSSLRPEGEVLAEQARLMGVPKSKILLTGMAVNTEEEAREARVLADIMKIRTIILVTSSFHMSRAHAIFERANLNVIPYASDYRASNSLRWIDWIPSGQALGSTSSGLREYLGRAYYWLKHNAAAER